MSQTCSQTHLALTLSCTHLPGFFLLSILTAGPAPFSATPLAWKAMGRIPLGVLASLCPAGVD